MIQLSEKTFYQKLRKKDIFTYLQVVHSSATYLSASWVQVWIPAMLIWNEIDFSQIWLFFNPKYDSVFLKNDWNCHDRSFFIWDKDLKSFIKIIVRGSNRSPPACA